MSDLMFPKIKPKKKKKKHAKSIIQNESSRHCYLCLIEGIDRIYPVTHTHHICPGTANRAKSEEYGLTAQLCISHHEHGPDAVHNNKEKALILKRAAQERFEAIYGHEKWMQEFGKNYLPEELWNLK